jgi:hypothetical protein
VTAGFWTVLVEAIRKSGNAELNGMLDAYQKKLFSGSKTCWVKGARRLIARKAAALGILTEGKDHA